MLPVTAVSPATSQSGSFLIETGHIANIISPKMLAALGLLPTGTAKLAGVELPTIELALVVQLEHGDGSVRPLRWEGRVVVQDVGVFAGVLGRAFLDGCELVYDGPARTFTLIARGDEN